MNKVRAAVFEGPGSPVEIREFKEPEVHGRSGLIEIKASGICGTDIGIWDGKWPTPLEWPLILGHEFSGVISKLGAEVKEDRTGKKLREGDLVTIPPLIPCGSCYNCKIARARENICDKQIQYARIGVANPPHLWGSWSEKLYFDFDIYPNTNIFKLPDHWEVDIGALVEPLSSAIRAIERSFLGGMPFVREGFGLGQSVVIQGSGAIGLLCMIVARESGAGKTIVIGSPEEPRNRLCREFGADYTINIDEVKAPQERIQKVKELTDARGADLVIDCTGLPSAIPEGLEMVRSGGTYVEMGVFTDAGPVETNWHHILRKDLTILGSKGYPPNTVSDAISLIDRTLTKYPWRKIQTHWFDLTEEGVMGALRVAKSWKCMRATMKP